MTGRGALPSRSVALGLLSVPDSLPRGLRFGGEVPIEFRRDRYVVIVGLATQVQRGRLPDQPGNSYS